MSLRVLGGAASSFTGQLRDISGLLQRAPQARWYLAAMIIDSLGTGMFLPFALLYFQVVSGIPLSQVGLALSVATAVGLVLVPVFGNLIDRVGAKPVAIGMHLIRFVAVMAYLFVNTFPTMLLAVALAAIGERSYGAAGRALVFEMVPSSDRASDRDVWYGITRAMLNAGLGVGGLVAGVLVTVGDVTGYQLVAVLNAVSFGAAAALLSKLSVKGRRLASPEKTGYIRVVARDTTFLKVVTTNCVMWIAVWSIALAMPPFVVDVLGQPSWVAGLLFAINTVIIVVAQVPVAGMRSSQPRTYSIALGALWFAGCFAVFFIAPAFFGPGVLTALIIGMLIFSFGELLFVVSALALVAAMAPPGKQGQYTALDQMGLGVAAMVSPVLLAVLLDKTGSFVWVVLTGAMAMPVALMVSVHRRLPAAVISSHALPRICPDPPRLKGGA